MKPVIASPTCTERPSLLRAVVLSCFTALCLSVSPVSALELGTDSINEPEILKRIESEIGLKEKKQHSGHTAGGRSNDSGRFIIISSKSGDAIEGMVRLNQESLQLKEVGTNDAFRQLSMNRVKSIEIIGWKPLQAKKIHDRQFAVLMIPYTAIIRLRTGESLQGEINGADWIQVTIQSALNTRSIILSYPVLVDAQSIIEALTIAAAFEPDINQFALLNFEKPEKRDELTSSFP